MARTIVLCRIRDLAILVCVVASLWQGTGYLLAAPPAGQHKAVLQTWTQEASRGGLRRAAVDMVTARLAEAMKHVPETSPLEEDIDALKKCLPNLVASITDSMQGDESETTGTSYWAAYTIAQAITRGRPTDDDIVARREEVSMLLEKANERIIDHLHRRMPEQAYNKWKATIETQVKGIGKPLLSRVESLARDPLFPVFKAKLRSAIVEKTLARLDVESFYPEYKEPEQLMVTADEVYDKALSHSILRLRDEILFDLCAEQIIQDTRSTPYWGDMNPSVRNASNTAPWPVTVRMWPLK